MSSLNTSSSHAAIGIVGAIACTTIFALTIGLTYPLLSFVLEGAGYGKTAIGFNAAMTPLGVLVASPFYPILIQRFGAWHVAVFCLASSAALILMMGLTKLYVAILFLRFLLGVVDVGVYIVSETWINQLAQTRSRGRVIGLYSTSLAAGFGTGPLILSMTGVEGFLPFVIGALCCTTAILVLLAIRSAAPRVDGEKATPSRSFIKLAPALLAAIAMYAFWEAALLSLFPVYGLAFGLETRFVAFAMSVCILGNTILQIPLGWVADLTSRRGLMILCAFMGAVGVVLLPFAAGSKPLLLSTLFVWGAVAGGLYTMAMTELGDRFSGPDLVAGNSAFAIAFGIGGLVGGPVTGAAMDLAGATGYSWVLATSFLALAVFASWRAWMSR